jgi:hypothetical protein
MRWERKTGEVVANDRLTIDIGDLRDRIETCREDPSWSELGMGGKIRALLRERLDEIEEEQFHLPAPNFKCLLLENYDRLSANPKLTKRLKTLMSGEKPSEIEKLRVANTIGVSEEIIDKLLELGERQDAGI